MCVSSLACLCLCSRARVYLLDCARWFCPRLRVAAHARPWANGAAAEFMSAAATRCRAPRLQFFHAGGSWWACELSTQNRRKQQRHARTERPAAGVSRARLADRRLRSGFQHRDTQVSHPRSECFNPLCPGEQEQGRQCCHRLLSLRAFLHLALWD